MCNHSSHVSTPFAVIDLHLHLDGSLSLASAKQLAAMQNIPLPETDAEILHLLQVSPNCKDLNEYLENDVDITQQEVDQDACWEIVELFDKYYQYETAIAECGAPIYKTETPVTVTIEGNYGDEYTSDDEAVQAEISECGSRTLNQCEKYLERLCNNASSQQECDSLIAELSTENVVVTAE